MTKTAGKSKATIWHIYRFEERFELPDDIRKSRRTPLCYTKDFVGSGQDNETINYSQQILALKLKPQSLMLIGAFHELKNLAANRSRACRGLLLDEKFEPASDEKIALWLGIKLTEARNILKNLQAVGLIEKIPMPPIDWSKDEFSGNGRPRSENSGNGRPRSENSGGGRKPLNNKGKRKRISSSKSRTRKTKEKRFEAEFEKWRKANAKISQTVQSQSQTQDKSNPKSNPSPNPKLNPTVSEVPGGKSQKFYTKISDIPLDSVLKENNDTQAMGFAAEIFRLLDIAHVPNTKAKTRELFERQELFNYYNAWLDAIGAGLTEAALESLWKDSMKSAQRITVDRGRKRKGGFYNNPGAGWRSEFNKNLAIYQGKPK